MVELEEILEQKHSRDDWLHYSHEEGFKVVSKRPTNNLANRETLARTYVACVNHLQIEQANQIVRAVWRRVIRRKDPKTLPIIIRQDGFLCAYTLGEPLQMRTVYRIWKGIDQDALPEASHLKSIDIQWNEMSHRLFGIVGAPQGFLSKFSTAIRLARDPSLLRRIGSDLRLLASVEDNTKRKELTLAVLSHGAVYRELEGKQLAVPCFDQPNKLLLYTCVQHLIEEGIKTVSLIPPEEEPEAPGLYLCQGTEIWPSQRAALGSILANFAFHGSATQAYAHSWRRLHKHLRDLALGNRPLPIIAGHSMGGSLVMQIALYSHSLIQEAHAFNPPMPNERDDAFYQQLPKEVQQQVYVYANLDDFAFWRIGARVVGNVKLFFGKRRWRYYPVSFLDTVTLVPAATKFVLNLAHAFPAHQQIIPFDENYLAINLSEQEKAVENTERPTRFDYLRFFPKLYDPMRLLVTGVRKLFGWSMTAEYLRNEIEIVMLHECDLMDSITEENRAQIERELEELRRQKEILFKKLDRFK